MPFGPFIYDRVKEQSTTTGTGDIALAGAVTAFIGFGVVGSGNTCYYAIAHQTANEWEVGIATLVDSGVTLNRTTVKAGSNGTNRVILSSGTKDVFITAPVDLLAPATNFARHFF